MVAAEWLQAIRTMEPAWVQAIATVVLVGVTWCYVRHTAKIVDIEREREHQARARRPKLDMTASGRPPDSFLWKVYTEDGRGHHDTPSKDEPRRDWAGCCWLRALVSNKGKVSAEKVEVYLTELHRHENGSYVPVSSFAPRRLVWANTKTSESRGESVLPSLHPGVDRYCDVGRIVDPAMERWQFFRNPSDKARCQGKPVLELCVDWDGPPFDHALEPGRYRLLLMLSCADNPPVRREMELHFTGAWYEDERMLGQGVTLELVDGAVGSGS